jgi:hypothetical protein
MQKPQPSSYVFPKWTNRLPIYFILGGLGFLCFVVFAFWYWASPKHTDVGYAPKQPIPYSHKLHAGELGIDCRYCHSNVERSGVANIPASEVCMNCHKIIKTDSPHIQKIRKSYETGVPIQWRKVHQLADFAYFNHSRHLKAGVSCVSCHGRVDRMPVVHQVQPLSMSWCLDCHRNPAPHIRPTEHITKMDWATANPVEVGQKLIAEKKIHPREDCSTCHR